jgi:16S rRNA (uracil1498-N3)-methyltransferase
MDYFYTPPQHIASDSLTIEGDEFSHLTHVMRKDAGDHIRVVDGIGHAFDCTLVARENHVARCTIRQRHRHLHEPENDVTLAVGLLKNSASFDFLVEKSTELGVNRIVPLITERTIPRHARVERWQKLALAAMKQSGRCVLPAVVQPARFDEFVRSAQAALRVIPHELVDAPAFGDLVRTERAVSVTICIGPEGGFTESEVADAREQGFRAATLGRRRLRTETAAVVAVALAIR